MRPFESRQVMRLPIVTASVHLALFALTVVYVYTSTDGQAPLVWVLWMVPDFPLSLLHLVGPTYSRLVHSLVPRDSWLDYVLYLPHLLHGLLGTLWWYLMPRVVVTIVRGAKAKRVN